MDFSPRQIEIIEAATKLIGETGIQNVTTKHLAEEIGFSEPALYRHFKGKTDILVSVLEFFKMKMGSGLDALFAKKRSGLDKIQQLIKFQFNMFSKNPAIIMVVFAETSFQYDKKLSATVGKLLKHTQQLVLNMLKKGVEDGSIRDDANLEQLTSIILGSMRFNVLQWRLSNFEFDLNEKGDELWQTLKLLINQRS